MVQLGKYNVLEVAREVEFGVYVTDGEGVEILMPSRYVPADAKVGDSVRCFVYQDSEARLIATTEHPYATVGEFVSLPIKSVNNVGAFADWGTSKELLIPHREQPKEMEEGRRYIIYIYVDEVSGRIAGTARVDKYLDNVPATYEQNEEVDVLVWKPTPLGYKVIIENKHTGLIYKNQIFQPVHIGEHLKAWVKSVRDDEKIDLSLQPLGYRQAIVSAEAQVLKALHLHDGFLPLTDKTDPDIIAEELQMSKKNFKKAVGALYKQQRIQIMDDGIQLK
ncbi:MAG: GntR family transcriptional regulator [Bacteroidales bacterium]|nr:GntR family transcriptional regulator [Candidatus Liminaster caballi]